MKAIILAAGYATRLYPLTLNTPKALLPINGRPILDYILDEINTVAEIDEIYLVTNHKFAGDFYKWAPAENIKPITVIDDGTLSDEDKKGAIGDIQFVIEQMNIDDDMLIIASDNFFTFRLTDFCDFYFRLGKDCVCAKKICDRESLKRFAVAVLDEEGRITHLVEKPADPPSDTAVYATYIYERATVPLFKKYLEEGNKADAPGFFLQWLHKIKAVYAYGFDGEIYDIGTVESYNDVRKLFGE